MTATCWHFDFGLEPYSTPYGVKWLPDAARCGRLVDPASDPDRPRCTEHLHDDDQE